MHDIVVVTAGKFIHALKENEAFLLKVHLLVFDEAHHCAKDHLYAQIMSYYHALGTEKSQLRVSFDLLRLHFPISFLRSSD
jgi:ERCC4-related helicase